MNYIFAGFEMGSIDPYDAVPIRALKTLLRANIPGLRSRIQEAIEGSFETYVNHSGSLSSCIRHRMILDP